MPTYFGLAQKWLDYLISGVGIIWTNYPKDYKGKNIYGKDIKNAGYYTGMDKNLI